MGRSEVYFQGFRIVKILILSHWNAMVKTGVNYNKRLLQDNVMEESSRNGQDLTDCLNQKMYFTCFATPRLQVKKELETGSLRRCYDEHHPVGTSYAHRQTKSTRRKKDEWKS